MRKEMTSIDISDLPDLLSLAEEVRTSRKPCLLKNGEQEVAVLAPVDPVTVAPKRRRRRGKPLSKDDPLFRIVGMFHLEGPTDVSENKHKYLAEAYESEFHGPT